MKKIHNPHDSLCSLPFPYSWAVSFGLIQEKLRHSQEKHSH